MGMRNIRLLLQYEGTKYQGWQKQTSSANTIQGKLETLLSRMCEEEIEIQGSGRTDAGVHALGQVANFHTTSMMSLDEMQKYMNKYLPDDIAVVEIAEAAPRFHSRLNACRKCYRYQVINSDVPDVFRRRYAYQLSEKLDVAAMREAAGLLCGEHDFKAFTSAKKSKKSTVRNIHSIDISEENDIVSFTFVGDGFLYHMVRILVGTLLEVGRVERTPESMHDILQSGLRENAGFLVPAKGLTLMWVKYD